MASLKFSDIINVDAKLAAAASSSGLVSSNSDAGSSGDGGVGARSGASLAKRRALLRREQV